MVELLAPCLKFRASIRGKQMPLDAGIEALKSRQWLVVVCAMLPMISWV